MGQTARTVKPVGVAKHVILHVMYLWTKSFLLLCLTASCSPVPCIASCETYGTRTIRPSCLVFAYPCHSFVCTHFTLSQLPLYRPSPEEQADPKLYAANVRDYMIRHSAAVMGQAALQPSLGGFVNQALTWWQDFWEMGRVGELGVVAWGQQQFNISLGKVGQ